MKYRILILFIFILLLPIGLMLWYGQKSFVNEQKLLQSENLKTGDAILEESNLKVNQFLNSIKEVLSEQMLKINWVNDTKFQVDLPDEPLIKQIFITDTKGRLLFPLRGDESNPDGLAFIKRTKNLWLKKTFKSEIVSKLNKNQLSDNLSITVKTYQSYNSSWGSNSIADGFLTWYWEEGLNLLYWVEHPNGYVVGAEVNFAYLKAQLIGRLPNRLIHPGIVTLVDSRNSIIYQWGDYEIKKGAKPLANLRVQYPLDSWKLQYYALSQESLGRLKKVYDISMNTNLIFFVGFTLLIGSWMGYYLWKDIKIIEKRMSFVTQVSHELKTPLTNIRLYSELLGRMDSMNDKQSNYLSVIVKESERLSRLIQNVLTFNKNKNKTKENFSIGSTDINELIKNIILQEEPYLVQLGFKVELKLNAKSNAMIDRDSVVQIIGNLISNAEKYAKEGLYLEISSEDAGEYVLIDFIDHGPGIPSNLCSKIFTPFYRIHNQLSDGVAGTGIGLTISKELAKSNGGDLLCINRSEGSCFRLKLKKDKEV